MFKKAILGLTGLTATAATAAGVYVHQDEELWTRANRVAFFWKNMFPMYLHYRGTELWLKFQGAPEHEQDQTWNRLHDQYSNHALDVVLHLRGFYAKLAQLGCSFPDIAPKQYRDRFAILLDHVPSESPTLIRSIIEKELNCKIEDVFATFDNHPIGAASVGQVHQATLKDGRQVVVKVQFPFAKERFDIDMTTVRSFAALSQPEQLPLLDEVKKQFSLEFDFMREAWALDSVSDALSKYSSQVRVPRPIQPYCTSNVLVMERVHGIKLVDAVKDQFTELAKKEGKTLQQFEQEFKDKIDAGWVPPPPPSPLLIRSMNTYQKLKRVIWNSTAWLWNTSVGLLFSNFKLSYMPHLKRPYLLDPVSLLKLLFEVHGEQVLRAGVFNGDPHPGNILIDEEGRISLIDFGQTKVLSPADRKLLARLIVALADRDQPTIVESFKQMGYSSERMDPTIIDKYATIYFQDNSRQVTENMNMQLYMEELNRRDPAKALPDQFLIAARCSLILRGVGQLMGVWKFDGAKAWKSHALKVLSEKSE